LYSADKPGRNIYLAADRQAMRGMNVSRLQKLMPEMNNTHNKAF